MRFGGKTRHFALTMTRGLLGSFVATPGGRNPLAIGKFGDCPIDQHIAVANLNLRSYEADDSFVLL